MISCGLYMWYHAFFRGMENIQIDRTYGSMFKRLRDAEDNNTKSEHNVRKTCSLIDQALIWQMNQHLGGDKHGNLSQGVTKGGSRSCLLLVLGGRTCYGVMRLCRQTCTFPFTLKVRELKPKIGGLQIYFGDPNAHPLPYLPWNPCHGSGPRKYCYDLFHDRGTMKGIHRKSGPSWS
jgi:hypothetical protein